MKERRIWALGIITGTIVFYMDIFSSLWTVCCITGLPLGPDGEWYDKILRCPPLLGPGLVLSKNDMLGSGIAFRTSASVS